MSKISSYLIVDTTDSLIRSASAVASRQITAMGARSRPVRSFNFRGLGVRCSRGVVDFRLRGGRGSSIPCLGGKATCFRAGDSCRRTLCTRQPWSFSCSSSRRLGCAPLPTVTSPSMKHCSTSPTGLCCSLQRNASEKKMLARIFALAMIVFGAGFTPFLRWPRN